MSAALVVDRLGELLASGREAKGTRPAIFWVELSNELSSFFHTNTKPRHVGSVDGQLPGQLGHRHRLAAVQEFQKSVGVWDRKLCATRSSHFLEAPMGNHQMADGVSKPSCFFAGCHDLNTCERTLTRVCVRTQA